MFLAWLACTHRPPAPALPAEPASFGTDGPADLDEAELAVVAGLEERLGAPITVDARLSVSASRAAYALVTTQEFPAAELDGWWLQDGVVVIPALRTSYGVVHRVDTPDLDAWAAAVREVADTAGGAVIGLGSASWGKARAWVLTPAYGVAALAPVPRTPGPHPLRAELAGADLVVGWFPGDGGGVGRAEGRGVVEATLPDGVRAVSVTVRQGTSSRQVARFRTTPAPVRSWSAAEIVADLDARRAAAGLGLLLPVGAAPCPEDEATTGVLLVREARCWSWGSNPDQPLGNAWNLVGEDPDLLWDALSDRWDALGLEVSADGLEVHLRRVLVPAQPEEVVRLVAALPMFARARQDPSASAQLAQAAQTLDGAALAATADALRDAALGGPLLQGGTRWFAVGFGPTIEEAVAAAADNVTGDAARYAVATRALWTPDLGNVHVVALLSSDAAR
jgi:hypothetical protein